MLNEVGDSLVREDAFVGPFLRGEDTQHSIKRIRISQLGLVHGTHKGRTDILGTLAHIFPMAVFGDIKAVLLWQSSKLRIATTEEQRLFGLFIIDIIQTLIVEQRRDIILEVVLANRSAEDIAGFHEEVVQLLRCTDFFIGGV